MSENPLNNPMPLAIAAFSGNTRDALKLELEKFFQLPASDFASIQQKARLTCDAFTPQASCRLTLLLDPEADMAAQKETIRVRLQNAAEHQWAEKGTYFAEDDGPGRIGFVFPGQGSQYVQMGADLVNRLPESKAILEQADAAFDKENKLSAIIFPEPAADKEEQGIQEERLRQTDVAQPAIGVVSLVMLSALARFSVFPDAACGHSYGELTALHAAGRMCREDFFRLSVARGRYMGEAGKQENDPGAMLAVKAPIDDIPRLIAEHGLDIILANRNSPDQGVISGPTSDIEKMQGIFKANHIRAIKLPVAAAFHSRLVASAARPFQDAIQSAIFFHSDVPVYSNTTGRPYPADESSAKSLLGQHLMNPVHFIDNIEAMYADGVDTFIEVGPKTVLTGLIRAILKGRTHTAIALDASSGRRSGVRDLAAALAHLAAAGHSVDLTAWA